MERRQSMKKLKEDAEVRSISFSPQLISKTRLSKRRSVGDFLDF
jgi:hypothetical protein